MFNQIGGLNSVGGTLSDNQIGGEPFIRHISDKLHFRFTEGSGTTCRDLSRNNNNGTFGATTAAPTWRRGNVEFDGINDYIVIATSADFAFGTGAFTLEFCIYIPQVPAAHDVLKASTTASALACLILSTGGFGIGRAKVAVDTSVSSTPPTNKWFHLMVTRSGTTGEFFVDGNSVGTGTSDENFVQGNVIIGTDWNYADLPFTGFISEYRIYKDKALSPIEVQQNYLANKFRGNN